MTESQILAERGCFSGVMSQGEKAVVRELKNDPYSQVHSLNVRRCLGLRVTSGNKEETVTHLQPSENRARGTSIMDFVGVVLNSKLTCPSCVS